MVRSCTVKKCSSRFSKSRPGITFHRFPFSRPEICEKWRIALRRGDWQPTKYSAVCSEHFLDTDFEESRPGSKCKRLKPDAVPSKFNRPPRINRPAEKIKIFIFDKTYKEEVRQFECPPSTGSPSPDEEEEEKAGRQSSSEEDSASCSLPSTSNLQSSSSGWLDSDTKIDLKRKIKTLQQKVRRRERKIKSLKKLVDDLRVKRYASNDLHEALSRTVEGFPLELISHFIRNNTVSKHSIYYTEAMKEFAKTLYSHSPGAYNYVRNMFHLPHTSRIRAWLSNSRPKIESDTEQSPKTESSEDSETSP